MKPGIYPNMPEPELMARYVPQPPVKPVCPVCGGRLIDDNVCADCRHKIRKPE